MLWLTDRRRRNSVTAGLSSASFCRSASALRFSASASDVLPVSSSRAPVRLTVSARLRLNSAVAPGAAANASRSARARR